MGGALVAAVAADLPAGWRLELVETQAAAGGGSLPGETLPSVGVAVHAPGTSADALARHLRLGDPAIVGRIEQERLILDLRTLLEEDWQVLSAQLAGRLRALAAGDTGGED
jgi:L-seryl-tRNA(Ser) seleniumtransferase